MYNNLSSYGTLSINATVKIMFEKDLYLRQMSDEHLVI